MEEIEGLMNRLRTILAQEFQGSEPELEIAAPAAKVGGFLIWSGFEGVEQIDRQTQLWDVLRSKLTRPEQLRITAILTLTPDERSVPSEN